MKILNQGFDHVEFVVRDIEVQGRVYERMGFEKVGSRTLAGRGTKSDLWQQGFVRILLTQPISGSVDGYSGSEPNLMFLRDQAEGVTVLALEVEDTKAWYERSVANGARSALAPVTYESPEGSVTRAEVYTPGRVRYAFVQRKGKLFDEKLVASRLESPSPFGIRVIDHLTNNVSIGEMKKWVEWYDKVFGFVVTRHFEITTGRTGLRSDVVQSSDYKIKVPINEATEPESQVQEFVERLKGPGVQHLAFLTTDLISTLRSLRKNEFQFLTVPHTYYEVVPKRVPGVTENLAELEELGILLDGDTNDGYLLQVFSKEILGPFFCEYIQRKGDKGFGNGNFKALFEAIERDQVARGVLKPA
jgi:4-hydroxyphenylpyruvate dioxygenase